MPNLTFHEATDTLYWSSDAGEGSSLIVEGGWGVGVGEGYVLLCLLNDQK